MSLSIIVPTMGRDTLSRTLASVSPQLWPGDEILVLRDETRDSGNTPRDRAMKQASGTHLWFLDDDDMATPDALRFLRQAARPQTMSCFKMLYGGRSEEPGRILWERPKLEPGNVGTPCCLIPNLPNLPSWTEANDELIFSDIRFLMKVERLCSNLTWEDSVVAIIRP